MSEGLPFNIVLDIQGKRAVDPVSSERNLVQTVTYGDQIIYRAEVKQYPLSGDPTAYDLTGWTFRFAVDAVLGGDEPDDVASDDSLFNVSGDWDDVDLATGKICWAADFFTVAVEVAVGIKAFVDSFAELWGMKPGGSKWVLIAKWTIRLENSVAADSAGDPGPEPVVNYATLADLGARVESGITLTVESGQIVLKASGVERARL